jgi:hypothetical protein
VPTYTYEGNNDPFDGTESIILERDEETGEVTSQISVGDQVELDQDKYEQLSVRHVFTEGDSSSDEGPKASDDATSDASQVQESGDTGSTRSAVADAQRRQATQQGDK